MSNELARSLTHLDLAGALDRIGGDEELLADIASVYLEEYPELVNEMQHAIASSDAAGLQRSAHTLKGSLLAIGADHAAELAMHLEVLGRQRSTNGANEGLQQLLLSLRDVHRDVAVLTGQAS